MASSSDSTLVSMDVVCWCGCLESVSAGNWVVVCGAYEEWVAEKVGGGGGMCDML